MKKVLSFLTAISMLVAIAGCNNGSTTSKDESKLEINSAESTESTVSSDNATDYTNLEMPTRDITNKTVTYYGWGDLDDKDPRGYVSLLKEETGITLKGTFGSHEGYWDTLATMVASGNTPDLVVMPNWNCIPVPIVNELIQPLDTIIDFSKPIWDDTREYMKYLKWNGKNYMGILSVYVNSWMFYNKKMFSDYGVKTPREYYEENDWTWDNFKKSADQFVTKKSDGSIDTCGVSFYNNSFQASTGVELITTNGNGGYSFNLKDNNITKMMNFLHSMGQGGSNAILTSATTPGIDMFAQGKVAMCDVNVWSLTCPEWQSLFKAGNIDWICLPKMDSSSSYYNELALNPTFGIANGSKNVEAAALAIEFHKWINSCGSISSYIPRVDNAASLKYKIKFTASVSDQLTSEQIAWTEELCKLPCVTMMWQSWLCETGTVPPYPGLPQIISGKKWSEIVEEVYPSVDASIKSNFVF